jgi:acetyltransferase-like isoleucine patch superfamily enzyme
MPPKKNFIIHEIFSKRLIVFVALILYSNLMLNILSFLALYISFFIIFSPSLFFLTIIEFSILVFLFLLMPLVLVFLLGFFHRNWGKIETGRYHIQSNEYAQWLIGRWPVYFVFKILYPLYSIHDLFRFFILKSLGVKLDYSTRVFSNVTITDPMSLTIGKNALIGEGTTFLTTYFSSATDFIHGQVSIGDNTLIGGECKIFANVKIGHDSRIGGQVAISHDVEIGNHVKVGSKTTIMKNVKILNNVKIGHHCLIREGQIIDHDLADFSEI